MKDHCFNCKITTVPLQLGIDGHLYCEYCARHMTEPKIVLPEQVATSQKAPDFEKQVQERDDKMTEPLKIATTIAENARLKKEACKAFEESCDGCPYEWDCQSETFPRYWEDAETSRFAYEATMKIRKIKERDEF